MQNCKRGDIFLYSGTNILSYLIKKITKSQFSHSGWLDVEGARLLSIDAVEDGIQETKFKYKRSRIAVLRLKVPEHQIEECVAFAEKQVGKPYDYKLFFGLLWRWIFGWRRKKDIGDWSNGYICSELIALPVLLNTGMIFTKDVHPGNTVPGDIWEFAVANPDKVDIVYVGSKLPPIKV